MALTADHAEKLFAGFEISNADGAVVAAAEEEWGLGFEDQDVGGDFVGELEFYWVLYAAGFVELTRWNNIQCVYIILCKNQEI